MMLETTRAGSPAQRVYGLSQELASLGHPDDTMGNLKGSGAPCDFARTIPTPTLTPITHAPTPTPTPTPPHLHAVRATAPRFTLVGLTAVKPHAFTTWYCVCVCVCVCVRARARVHSCVHSCVRARLWGGCVCRWSLVSGATVHWCHILSAKTTRFHARFGTRSTRRIERAVWLDEADPSRPHALAATTRREAALPLQGMSVHTPHRNARQVA